MSEPGSAGTMGAALNANYWVRWHQAYDDPASALSLRLRLVQAGVRQGLDRCPPGPIVIVSVCAGQGRDVIDVVAEHPRRDDVRARLVERDPTLAAFARQRAAAAGELDRMEVFEGDAGLVRSYTGFLPADLVLICGVFGNVSDDDIRATVLGMRSFCATEGTVIWTRHRRHPDLTPSVREWFAEAGFEEVSFVAPDRAVLAVGCHRSVHGAGGGGGGARGGVGRGVELDPGLRLFDFVGDGSLPA